MLKEKEQPSITKRIQRVFNLNNLKRDAPPRTGDSPSKLLNKREKADRRRSDSAIHGNKPKRNGSVNSRTFDTGNCDIELVSNSSNGKFNTAPTAKNPRRKTNIDLQSLFNKNDKNPRQNHESFSSPISDQNQKKKKGVPKKRHPLDDLKRISHSGVFQKKKEEAPGRNGDFRNEARTIPQRSTSIGFNNNHFQSEMSNDIEDDYFVDFDDDDIRLHKHSSLPPPPRKQQNNFLKRLTAPANPLTRSKENNDPTFYHVNDENSVPYSRRFSQASQSAPSLATIRDTDVIPSPSTPSLKRLQFSSTILVHETWTKEDYDRRGDQTTCNKLTPMLAQKIKQELNEYKSGEMEVHEESRKHTHFFT